jgi:OmcA/MtrC family decaheme c-type cytochrome
MTPRRLTVAWLLALAAIALAACAAQPGPSGLQGPQGPSGPAGPAGPPGQAALTPGQGLAVKITAVDFPATGNPSVTLMLTDVAGLPLTPESLDGFGFTIAQIVVDQSTGLSNYQSLLVREVEGQPYTVGAETRQPALATAPQAFADTQGTWETRGDGSYSYTFSSALTSEPDPRLTTSVGVYASRDGRAAVANDVFTFVPAGGEPAITREVVSTEACNGCHNPLALHGEVRREVGLCVTCHTNQTIDPETGNAVNFRVLIHRIHRGEFLPSVLAGEPYQIIGFRQSGHDYSEVAWPQDVRNCTTCHTGGADSDNYKTKPQIAVCSACHDQVDFSTGENHPGGIQSDGSCSGCHPAEGREFDSSITGAHTIPTVSSQLKGLNIEILSVDGAVPGGSPTVTFRVTEDSGTAIAPVDMDYLAATLAGPTTDYMTRVTETIFRTPSDTPPQVEAAGSGAYRYTFSLTLPATAEGSYAVGMEGYVMEEIDGMQDPVRVAAFNPVAYVALDGGDASPRRQVVEIELCNACHKQLALHGGMRQNPEYCVVCHNTAASDEEVRPAEAMPPTSIHFKVLIHRIHRGENRSQMPFIVYGFRSSIHDFSELRFPGNLADCQTCHLPGSYDLPLPQGVLPTIITQAGRLVSSMPPIEAACTACHDSPAVYGHSELMTTSAGLETCEVCHGPGTDFDVEAVHQ